VEVAAFVPDAVLDLRYARKDNAFGRALYEKPRALLREPTARKLAKAAALLAPRKLVILDAYRPLSVQKEMWKQKPDTRYVADPKTGSMHNRGAAVDVWVEGEPPPSEFDDFSEKARHSPATKALREAMEQAGFSSLSTEWWHYSDPDGKKWPVLDEPL
jgi:D-alanyl-D-alanine dipeptidase